MKYAIVSIALAISLGCAAQWTAQEIGEDIDVLGRVLIRAFELKEDPTVTPESCARDVALLDEVAKWLSDRIDGGEASNSEKWKTVDGFRELLTDLGCPLVPEGDASVRPVPSGDALACYTAKFPAREGVRYASLYNRRFHARPVPCGGAHKSIPGSRDLLAGEDRGCKRADWATPGDPRVPRIGRSERGTVGPTPRRLRTMPADVIATSSSIGWW